MTPIAVDYATQKPLSMTTGAASVAAGAKGHSQVVAAHLLLSQIKKVKPPAGNTAASRLSHRSRTSNGGQVSMRDFMYSQQSAASNQ